MQPAASVERREHPFAVRASTRGRIGRCFMRALPVKVSESAPWARVLTAVRKRAAVPALPR
jgi:hypothetical protein